MRKIIVVIAAVFSFQQAFANDSLRFYAPNHPYVRYTGRIDFTNPLLPRFWQPGVYFELSFKGTYCEVILNDEQLWGHFNNYIEVVIDKEPFREKTKGKTDTIRIENLTPGLHTILICKNTEANIGYLELAGIRCQELVELPPKAIRKIEFIGNSITCGTGSDLTQVPCGKGLWHDQHNAYSSYGAITARMLNAQHHLSAVSGIGLMRSCCNMDITMPQVFDKINMRNDSISWNFQDYQPDVVTVCLGQNDGVQDSAIFCQKYIAFIKQLRKYYPTPRIVLLGSAMADEQLLLFMIKTLNAVVTNLQHQGEYKISAWFFSRSYNRGCDFHPDIFEHSLMAKELSEYLKKIMHW
jgi:hypothetical protein